MAQLIGLSCKCGTNNTLCCGLARVRVESDKIVLKIRLLPKFGACASRNCENAVKLQRMQSGLALPWSQPQLYLTYIHTYNSWFQIYKHSSGHMFACSSLTEECIEGVITTSNCFVTWHLTIRLDTMFQTIQFPACIADLYSSLSDMDRNAFTLLERHRKVQS